MADVPGLVVTGRGLAGKQAGDGWRAHFVVRSDGALRISIRDAKTADDGEYLDHGELVAEIQLDGPTARRVTAFLAGLSPRPDGEGM